MLASIVPAFPNGSSLRSVVACKVLRAVGSPMNVWASFSTFDEHSGSRLSVLGCVLGFVFRTMSAPKQQCPPCFLFFFLLFFVIFDVDRSASVGGIRWLLQPEPLLYLVAVCVCFRTDMKCSCMRLRGCRSCRCRRLYRYSLRFPPFKTDSLSQKAYAFPTAFQRDRCVASF